MTKYLRISNRLYIEDTIFPEETPMLPNISVSDTKYINTGLLFSDGTPIMRSPIPVGFGRNKEW